MASPQICRFAERLRQPEHPKLLEHLHHVLINFIDKAGVVGLVSVMILGNLAIPVGTEIVLPAAGVLSATGHLPNLLLTGLVAIIGELIGGSILFAIGKYAGPPFVHRFGRFVHLRDHELERVHAFYARFGAKTVFLSRFIPVVRGIAALPAGVSDMAWSKFLMYTAAGSAIFCYALIFLGTRLGNHLDMVAPLLSRAAIVVPVVVIVCVIVMMRRREPAT